MADGSIIIHVSEISDDFLSVTATDSVSRKFGGTELHLRLFQKGLSSSKLDLLQLESH